MNDDLNRSTIILADNQDISRIGLRYLCNRKQNVRVIEVADKVSLIKELQATSVAVIWLDFTLFDIPDIENLIIIHQRFPRTHWVLFCEELSDDFVRRIVSESSDFSVVYKECSESEIDEALSATLRFERFLCRRTMEMLLSPVIRESESDTILTKTETEILKAIASGKTTKEIAAERCSSFHTINTHRKNIFRKLDVNTAYEATKYALRAGLIDAAEYYI